MYSYYHHPFGMRAQGEQTSAFSMDFRCQQPIPTLTPFFADTSASPEGGGLEIPEMEHLQEICHVNRPQQLHILLRKVKDHCTIISFIYKPSTGTPRYLLCMPVVKIDETTTTINLSQRLSEHISISGSIYIGTSGDQQKRAFWPTFFHTSHGFSKPIR